MSQDLIRRTYDALMAVRTAKVTPDEGRALLRELREEAGASWERVKFAAIAFDVKANG